MQRRKTKSIAIGNTHIGSEHPVLIQSMTYTKTSDKENTLKQILSLEECGCDVVRFSVPDEECAKSIPFLKENTHIPLVADIHFDYKLAILAANLGIDKIRINPGNIGSDENVKKVADICKAKNIPIRIGVNAGSLEKHILQKYSSPCPEALCESAMYHVNLLEKFDFDNIIVSIKSSTVQDTILANRLFASTCNYPIHLGVTEAGTERTGLIKSSVGIGSLLCDGIGDTLRVSLSDDVVKEVSAAKDLLKVLGLRKGVKVISCPTCSRCGIDVFSTAKKLEDLLSDKDWDLKIAVMGCAVNGPGEAKEADFGICGSLDGTALFIRKGQIIGKVPFENVFELLINEAQKSALEKQQK